MWIVVVLWGYLCAGIFIASGTWLLLALLGKVRPSEREEFEHTLTHNQLSLSEVLVRIIVWWPGFLWCLLIPRKDDE